MSHTTVLRTIQIKDIEALEEAISYLKENGLQAELVKNAKPRMYYGDQHGVCDYVLKLTNCVYDVGFDKQSDGSYLPVFDSWAGHIQKHIGNPTSCPVPQTVEEKQIAAVSGLLNAYGVMVAKRELESSGYYGYEITVDKEDGSYLLEMNGY